ncbi:MAG: T9SS type A sorting domain-containing protein [Sediminibacterium sp.]|nr:T9SS type A sorting domain-containing protein [Sediminibacterium sp.]
MKKVIALALAGLFSVSLHAKKVKFAVDLTGATISPNGVHIIGDFQTIAGFGTNWDPGTTTLTQEGTSSIYSIIVTIPAFQKYEYKFVNGNQTYEAEFVPDESRVDGVSNDNRWLYVDSLANDTTFVGAIVFGANAPSGKTLIRYKVDMTNAGTIPSQGVHVGTGYQNPAFNPATIRMCNLLGDNVYQIINYVNSTGLVTFQFYKGNTAGAAETVPGSCAVNGRRQINLTKDSVLTAYCFSGCVACSQVGIKETLANVLGVNTYPNPADKELIVRTEIQDGWYFQLFDAAGKAVITGKQHSVKMVVPVDHLGTGIYHLRISTPSGQSATRPVVIAH